MDLNQHPQNRDQRYRVAHREQRRQYMVEYRKRKKQQVIADKNPIRRLIRIISGGKK